MGAACSRLRDVKELLEVAGGRSAKLDDFRIERYDDFDVVRPMTAEAYETLKTITQDTGCYEVAEDREPRLGCFILGYRMCDPTGRPQNAVVPELVEKFHSTVEDYRDQINFPPVRPRR